MTRAGYSYKNVYILFLNIYILCLPLNAMNIGPIGSALKLLAVIPVGIALLGGSALRFTRPVTAQFLFTLFALLSMVWSVSFDASSGRVISYLLLLALIISGAAFRYTESEIKKIKSALAWSSRLTAVVMMVFAQYVGGRFTLTGVIAEDPNYLCAYLVFGIIFALDVLTGKRKLWRKGLAVGELLLYLYLILVTGSRGGLLAVLAGTMVFLVVYGEKRKKRMASKIVMLSLLLVVMVSMIDYLPDSLKLRFTVDDIVSSGGSGRTDLWEQTIDLFLRSDILRQLFGYGTATITWCFDRYGYPEVNVVHNMFLETLAELGIIGLFVYSAAILSFIKAAFRQKDKFAFAVIVCMFVMSLSTSIYTFKPYFNIMLFIVILQNLQNNDTKETALPNP